MSVKHACISSEPCQVQDAVKVVYESRSRCEIEWWTNKIYAYTFYQYGPLAVNHFMSLLYRRTGILALPPTDY